MKYHEIELASHRVWVRKIEIEYGYIYNYYYLNNECDLLSEKWIFVPYEAQQTFI